MGIYVITGGTTGIGAEACRLLLEEGHEVFNMREWLENGVWCGQDTPDGKKPVLI